MLVVAGDCDALVVPEDEPDTVAPPKLHGHALVDAPHLLAPGPGAGGVDAQGAVLAAPGVEVVRVGEEGVVLAPGRLRGRERLRHTAPPTRF